VRWLGSCVVVSELPEAQTTMSSSFGHVTWHVRAVRPGVALLYVS
jgi:hypothetical protein